MNGEKSQATKGRPYVIAVLAAAFLIALDQWTKWLAQGHLSGGTSIQIIPGAFELSLAGNTGAAFSLGAGGAWKWPLVAVSFICCVAVIVIFVKLPHTKLFNWIRAALTLIFAGAAGNLIDRAFKKSVVDFFHWYLGIDFAVFNVADACVTVGVILLIILMIFFYGKKPKPAAEKNG